MTQLTSHKAIVIGAGISGLTTAVYLQRSGVQTLILEKAAGPGGVSTSWKRKGYTFEGGVHWLIGAKKEIPLHQIWVETGALQENNPVHFKDPVYTLVDSEGMMPLFRDLHGLEIMSELIPEIKNAVAVTDMATPLTYERYCGTFEGSYMTDWPPFSRLYHAPVRYREGLYFTGQRTAYSGGLPPAAQSGRKTAQTVCKDLGVEFVNHY